MTTRKHAVAGNGKPEGAKEAKSVWSKTPTPNLIRYLPKGSYYLRARIGGKILRESLETTNYQVAVIKLRARMSELRYAAGPRSPSDIANLWDALRLIRIQVSNDPSLKERTRQTYVEQIDSMGPGWTAEVPATPIARLSKRELQDWWRLTAQEYAPQRANHMLMFVKRGLKEARKAGAMLGDPSEDIRRVKVPRTRLNLVTVEQFQSILDSIRSMRKANSEQAAFWLEFMTYSGLRPAEVAALEWRDLDEKHAIVTVTGGERGTKNHQVRNVPMVPAMKDLVLRMKNGQERAGKVFRVIKPHEALRNACRRLQLPHLRIYDLRHMFATICAQSGVDVPTFAKWLGHRDGGALAMRTYVHPHDEHSQRSAAKVQFNSKT